MDWLNERVEITRWQQLIGGLSVTVLNVQFIIGLAQAFIS